jgi:hypothetical protein
MAQPGKPPQVLNGEDGPAPAQDSPAQNRSAWLRLFLIPLLVYIAWLVETFLLAGRTRLFIDPGPGGIAVYTIIACIVIGILVPVLLLKRSFSTGEVNMHQVGFRPVWRTWPIVLVTLVVVLPVSILLNPYGADRLAFLQLFLLLLPTAIASVMVCFVLIGTHVQAFMRRGGIVSSISAGVIVTSVLFAFTTLVRFPGPAGQDTFLFSFFSGMILALFFFAVRDVYATTLVAGVLLVFAMAGLSGPAALAASRGAAFAAAGLAVAILLGIHAYFSRNYATVLVRAG